MLQAIANAAAANGAPGGGPMLPIMDFTGFHPYGMDGVRRKNATRETTAPLKVYPSTYRHFLYLNYRILASPHSQQVSSRLFLSPRASLFPP